MVLEDAFTLEVGVSGGPAPILGEGNGLEAGLEVGVSCGPAPVLGEGNGLEADLEVGVSGGPAPVLGEGNGLKAVEKGVVVEAVQLLARVVLKMRK